MTFHWDPVRQEFVCGAVTLRPAGTEGLFVVIRNGVDALTFEELDHIHTLASNYHATGSWGPELLPGVEVVPADPEGIQGEFFKSRFEVTR